MKKVFEGMTPDQIWEYIKNLTREEQDKLLFENDIKDNNMINITKKGPQFLVGMEFNIPLFNAEKQMYLCTNVDEIATSPGGKDYNISLNEVKLNYSVPERIDINLFVPTTDANGELAHVHMVEIDPKRGDLPLSNTMTPKVNISSLGGLKKLFYKMAKSI